MKTTTLSTLGCLGCPCAQTCSGRQPALSGLGCPCAKSRGGLGSLLNFGSVDLTDPKTWIIGALLIALVYNMLFRKDQRAARKRRRKDLSAARDRYRAEVARIRTAA